MDRPLTRAERQAQTRERLIEVASEAFLEAGYHATSLDAVAERAGFSKGAVYSNFSGKEELVLAVFDRHFLLRLGRLQAALAEADETIEARVEALARWWASMVEDAQWASLIFELAASSRDKPLVHEQLAVWESGIRAFVEALIQAEVDRFGIELPLPSEDLASIFVALWSGLNFARVVNPGTSTEVLVDLVRLLFLRGL